MLLVLALHKLYEFNKIGELRLLVFQKLQSLLKAILNLWSIENVEYNVFPIPKTAQKNRN